ncbi:hypothetical protein PVAND_011846 [Polypedilum vanderplanki]|uniref:Uncharacterized protein n=1 Tax=Polypedilum vanderplanki TaxID=319348 RepID=A0A9J6CKV7_POLVA|nr:hypothetical protein PVAND_011846 [Polypedilum vanderplanki]
MHFKFLIFVLYFTFMHKVACQREVLQNYRDNDGYVRLRVVKEPVFKKPCADTESHEISEESEERFNGNSYLHEYSRRDGPHESESSESIQDMYNISNEDDIESKLHSNQHESHELENIKVYSKNVYSHEFSESAECNKNHMKEEYETKNSSEETKVEKHKNKKVVYVYKQPPIVVHPKPTNVFIKPKPILVQPPPLVVHQAAQKPCKNVIKYKPPNIRVQPVIVKIKKPLTTTTTTTTTPCPKTTKKPCKISSSTIKLSKSSENSIELNLESIEVKEKLATKRNAPEMNQVYHQTRPRRQNMSPRAQFYSLLMDILTIMQSSAKTDIRYAKERELQRRSVQFTQADFMDDLQGAWKSTVKGVKNTFSSVGDWFSDKTDDAKDAASDAYDDAKLNIKDISKKIS